MKLSSTLFLVFTYLHLAATLLVIPFDCGDKIIIITNRTDASSKKVSNLNEQALTADGQDVTGIRQKCTRTSMQFAIDSSQPNLVNSLMDMALVLVQRYEKPISVLLHVAHGRTSTFTRLLSYPPVYSKLTLKACVYDKSETSELVYVTYDKVSAFFDEYEENLNEFPLATCQNYFEVLKNNKDTFSAFNGHPLIIIPGFVSSVLYARKRNPADTSSTFKRPMEMIWPVNMQKMVSSAQYGEEWAKSIGLAYDGSIDRTFNPFYAVSTAFWADPRSTFTLENALFYNMTRTMVERWGYDVAKSVRAAPYDFRKGLYELEEYFEKLEILIEQTYYINGNRPVVLLAHSLGNVNAVHFLSRQTKAWKDRYVESYICLAAAFGGSLSALKLILEGEVDGFGNNPTLKAVLAFLARSFSSIPYLLPNSNSKSPSEIVVSINEAEYTIDSYDQLFDDVNLSTLKHMYANAKSNIGQIMAPEVKTYCAYSTGVPTEKSFAYVDSDPNTMTWNRKTVYEMDGDRVVNTKSARDTCLNFAHGQMEPVYEKQFVGLDHSAMLHDEKFLKFLRNLILS